MNPMMLLPLLKSTWLQSKWLVILSLLAFTHFLAWNAGTKHELRKQAENSKEDVRVERERGERAVQRAASDVERIKDLEKANESLTKELESLPDRKLCPLSPDELRILREAAESTK